MEYLLLACSDVPDFSQQWGEQAMRWATACPVRHLACRSLQIFRIVMPVFTPKMLADILARLSNTVCDPNMEVQGFALDILFTLQAMVHSLDASKILLFPQIFWASLAILESRLDVEFQQAAVLLGDILSLVNLDDPSSMEILEINKPSFAEHPEFELQRILLRGLSLAATQEVAFGVLEKLMAVQNDHLIAPSKHRWLFTMLGIVPFILKMDSRGLQAAESLSQRLSSILPIFSRLFGSFSRQKFRNLDDFYAQFCSALRESFSPEDFTSGLKFLTSLLTREDLDFRKRILHFTKFFLSECKLISPVPMKGSNALILPFMALVKTPELLDEALDVLDSVMSLGEGDSQLKNLLSAKRIEQLIAEHTMTEKDTSLYWQVNDAQTKNTRNALASVVASFVGLLNESVSFKMPASMDYLSPLPIEEELKEESGFVPEQVMDQDIVSALQDLDEYFREEGAMPSHNTLVRDRNKRLTLIGVKSSGLRQQLSTESEDIVVDDLETDEAETLPPLVPHNKEDLTLSRQSLAVSLTVLPGFDETHDLTRGGKSVDRGPQQILDLYEDDESISGSEKGLPLDKTGDPLSHWTHTYSALGSQPTFDRVLSMLEINRLFLETVTESVRNQLKAWLLLLNAPFLLKCSRLFKQVEGALPLSRIDDVDEAVDQFALQDVDGCQQLYAGLREDLEAIEVWRHNWMACGEKADRALKVVRARPPLPPKPHAVPRSVTHGDLALSPAIPPRKLSLSNDNLQKLQEEEPSQEQVSLTTAYMDTFLQLVSNVASFQVHTASCLFSCRVHL